MMTRAIGGLRLPARILIGMVFVPLIVVAAIIGCPIFYLFAAPFLFLIDGKWPSLGRVFLGDPIAGTRED